MREDGLHFIFEGRLDAGRGPYVGMDRRDVFVDLVVVSPRAGSSNENMSRLASRLSPKPRRLPRFPTNSQISPRLSQSLLPDTGLDSVLSSPEITITRQLEMLNVFLGYEQANKYTILDSANTVVGYIAEHESGIKSTILRQLLKTRRPFQADVMDRHGTVVLHLTRPTKWFLNSKISAATPTTHLGDCSSSWHPWRRRYILPDDVIDAPFLAWSFELPSFTIERKFSGFVKEIFTDMGLYSVVFRGGSVEERAVVLATAVTIDIDYFSRHSSSSAMPLMVGSEMGGMGGSGAGAAAGTAAGLGNGMDPGDIGGLGDLDGDGIGGGGGDIGGLGGGGDSGFGGGGGMGGSGFGKNEYGDDIVPDAEEGGGGFLGDLWDSMNDD